MDVDRPPRTATLAVADGLALTVTLPRIAELLAHSGADVAKLGLVCKRFQACVWEQADKPRLLAPAVALGAHSDPAVLDRLHPGAIRHLLASDFPQAFLPGAPLLKGLVAAATSLVRLHLRLTRPRLHSCWVDSLSTLAEVVCARARTQAAQLEALVLEGAEFPPDAAGPLGAVVEVCGASLRELVLSFQDTSGDDPIDDERLWSGLVRCRRLESLRITGLRTSERTCQGLAETIAACSQSLRRLHIGRRTATAILQPPSLQFTDLASAAAAAAHPEVSPELHELLAAGGALRLQELGLCDIKPPSHFGPLVTTGFGPARANLAALLESVASLATALTVLDLTGNDRISEEGLPAISEWTNGHAAMISIIESCQPLQTLDISRSSLHLRDLSAALGYHGPTLLELSLSGNATMSLPNDRGIQAFCAGLLACDQLRRLDLGQLGMFPAMRRPVTQLLQACAPTLRHLVACMPMDLFEIGMSSMFATGTCRDGGARQLEILDLVLPTVARAPKTSGLAKVLQASAATLRQIRFHNMALGDMAGAALASALRSAPLERLILDDCGVGANTARYLAGAIASSGSGGRWQLRHLSLAFNMKLGAEAAALLEALVFGGKHLQDLLLQACGLSGLQASSALGRLLIGAPALSRVDLRDNPGLGRAGVRCLLESALRSWGQQAHCRARPALPGVVDLTGCGAAGPPTADEPNSVAHRTLPPRLGRFQLRWEGSAVGGA